MCDFSAGASGRWHAIVTIVSESGYGLLETLGHVDFQNPTSGEFFIGSENPGVAPVNSWFAIFGQFFDHGLDLIGKGGKARSPSRLIRPIHSMAPSALMASPSPR